MPTEFPGQKKRLQSFFEQVTEGAEQAPLQRKPTHRKSQQPLKGTQEVKLELLPQGPLVQFGLPQEKEKEQKGILQSIVSLPAEFIAAAGQKIVDLLTPAEKKANEDVSEQTRLNQTPTQKLSTMVN